MTDNFNVIFQLNPGASGEESRELYEQGVIKLARAFNRAHPEYSEMELREKAWNYLNFFHPLRIKTISWFSRRFFGWADAVRLDFGVFETLADGHVWYCKPTYGRIQKGAFIPTGWSLKRTLEELKKGGGKQ